MVKSSYISRLFQRAPWNRHRHRQRQPQQDPNPRQQTMDESNREFDQGSDLPPTRYVPGVHTINTEPYMGRAVYESPGIHDSTCAVHGDVTDDSKLPILPDDYRSLYKQLSDGRAGSSAETEEDLNLKLNTQYKSRFFTTLPPELRQMIYIYAFGGRRIHIDYDFSDNFQKWSWWYRVCDDPERCPEKAFACPETEAAAFSLQILGSDTWIREGFRYDIGALGWLASCKTAYQETLPILYSSNTFVMSQGIDQLFRLTKVLPQDHLKLLISLSFEMDVYRICNTAPPDMDSLFANFYSSIFTLIKNQLPNLRGLSLSIAGIPGFQVELDNLGPGDEERYIGPWDDLARSRAWKRLEIGVSGAVFDQFNKLVERRRREDGVDGRGGYVLLKRAEPYLKGWL
ncbi:hypothetical protein BJX70DRAFT_338516 [Aspergillus crustosus]